MIEEIGSLGDVASMVFWGVGLLFVVGMLSLLSLVGIVLAIRWTKKKGVDLTDGINAQELELLKKIILDAEEKQRVEDLKEKLAAVVEPKK